MIISNKVFDNIVADVRNFRKTLENIAGDRHACDCPMYATIRVDDGLDCSCPVGVAQEALKVDE